jgi:hypothetical protein
MNNEDRDTPAFRPSFDRDDDNNLMWKIAAGVAIGIIAAALVLFFVERYRTQMAFEEAAKLLQGLTTGMSESNARSAEEARRREAQRAAAEQQSRLEKAAQQRAVEDARRAAIEEAARKERAWAKFYKRPANCDNDLNQEQLVECANHHIRAKRQFEEAYAAGKL